MSDWNNPQKRMKVFNGQLFNDILADLEKSEIVWKGKRHHEDFLFLFEKGFHSSIVTDQDLLLFQMEHDANMVKYAKRILEILEISNAMLE